jgi:hypothetical protein
MKFETRDLGHETRKISAIGRVSRLASRVSIAAGLLIAASGCAIEPWVKPYERAALADPIMAASRDAVAAEYLHHVHEVREGARGASGSAGGGCGCN